MYLVCTILVSRIVYGYLSSVLSELLPWCECFFITFSVKKMFYSTSGDDSAIKVINLDGTGKENLLTDKIVQPTAITLDLPSEKIYFADSRLDYINFCNYDGTNRHQLVEGHHVCSSSNVLLMPSRLLLSTNSLPHHEATELCEYVCS